MKQLMLQPQLYLAATFQIYMDLYGPAKENNNRFEGSFPGSPGELEQYLRTSRKPILARCPPDAQPTVLKH